MYGGNNEALVIKIHSLKVGLNFSVEDRWPGWLTFHWEVCHFVIYIETCNTDIVQYSRRPESWHLLFITLSEIKIKSKSGRNVRQNQMLSLVFNLGSLYLNKIWRKLCQGRTLGKFESVVGAGQVKTMLWEAGDHLYGGRRWLQYILDSKAHSRELYE